MSEEEKRELKATVLLELEDAKEAVRLLGVKAGIWAGALEKLARLLRPDGSHFHAQRLREEVAEIPESFKEGMDFDTAMGLDEEMEAARLRLRRAEDAKRQIFGN